MKWFKKRSTMSLQSHAADGSLTDILFFSPDRGSRGRRFPFSIDEIEDILLEELRRRHSKGAYRDISELL